MILNTQNLNNQLLSVNDLSTKDLEIIFTIAKQQDFKIKTHSLLISIFFENSTRTLLSFEKASINSHYTISGDLIEPHSVPKRLIFDNKTC